MCLVMKHFRQRIWRIQTRIEQEGSSVKTSSPGTRIGYASRQGSRAHSSLPSCNVHGS